MNNHGSHRGWKAKNNDSDSLSKSHPRMTFGDWLKDGERSYDITRWFNAGAAGVLFLKSIDVGFRIQGTKYWKKDIQIIYVYWDA